MKFVTALAGTALSISFWGLAHAQTNDLQLESVIEDVRSAYNVDKIERAKTIRLEEELRMEYESHDYGPDFHDLTTQRRHYVLDIQNERGSAEFMTHMGTNSYHGREILKDGKVLFIDYLTDMYEPQDDSEFMQTYGGTFRSSDVLMAYYIATNPEKYKYDGKAMWLGRDYHKLNLEFPNSPPLTVFVEDGTGHIGKMTRVVGEDTLVSYTFDNHKKQNGITFASDQSVYANREPLFFSFNRQIVLNDRKDRNAFEIDNGVVQEPERVDQGTMTVEAISSDTHHVGQNGVYTAFVKTPSGLVALGTQAGFTDRLAAYRKETGELTRLAYAMTADHHDNAIAGVTEADAEGATLLVTADSKVKLDERFKDTNHTPNIEVVTGKRTIANVHIVSLSTSHASQVLVAYDEGNNFLYQLLHYASPYKDAGFVAIHAGVTMYQALEPYNVEPKVLLSAASRKPETWDNFVLGVRNYNPTRCYRNRQICG